MVARKSNDRPRSDRNSGSRQTGHTPEPKKVWLTTFYALMVAATIGLFFVVRHFGQQIVPAAAAVGHGTGQASGGGRGDILLHVLLALVAVIVAGRALGWLFRWFQQPAVIGEVLAGILLGPSLLGHIAPEVSAYILPPAIGPHLGVIAQLGVILYMFVIGLELDASVLRERGHATIAISHASIVFPFLLGSLLALGIYSSMSTSDVSFTVFALFLGVSMSVTAFPVLARILTDRQMSKTSLGVIALTCAATDDVTAWCLLAFVVGVAQAEVGSSLLVVGMTIAYIGLMFLVVRPVLARLAARWKVEDLSQGVVAVVIVLLLLSSVATELIGVHAIFGAFLMGAVIPHDSAIARELSHRLSDLVTVLLLPAFFAFTGMRTEIGLVSGLDQWLLVALIIVIATTGKFGGTLAAARLTGLGWRDASALGILMNTRGLMELIVLNIGLDLKVISPTLFAMLVLMAVVTTIATSPILAWIERGRESYQPSGLRRD
jgi:Kef-type K+ transport system membrane component KefB